MALYYMWLVHLLQTGRLYEALITFIEMYYFLKITHARWELRRCDLFVIIVNAHYYKHQRCGLYKLIAIIIRNYKDVFNTKIPHLNLK